MRKYPFTVIYIEDGNLKHKQIRDFSAFCATETFQEMKPNVEVLEAGLGVVSKEYWNELKKNFDNTQLTHKHEDKGDEVV